MLMMHDSVMTVAIVISIEDMGGVDSHHRRASLGR